MRAGALIARFPGAKPALALDSPGYAMFGAANSDSTLQVRPVIPTLSRLVALLALLVLSACSSAPEVEEPPPAPVTLPGYEAVLDEGFEIPAVAIEHLRNGQARTEVPYAGDEKPGSIVVDTFARRLYFVLEDGRALRYAIAVGREGISFRGSGIVGRMEKWPSWTPTARMVRTRPDLYAEYAGGLPGGLINPLGARALYLYRNGKDSFFRIHGTIENPSIGHATSAGCIRLFNQDAIDLYERVKMGARVKVRSLQESQEMEGPYMEDAWGRAVPETEENIAQKVLDLEIVAQQQAEREAALSANPELAESMSESLEPPPGHS
jgi:lipoprotein-anchoring transpeptidase ErfK/SrfK